jgi:hypothetical protein
MTTPEECLRQANERLLEAAKAGGIGDVRAALASGATNLDEALLAFIDLNRDEINLIGYLLSHGAKPYMAFRRACSKDNFKIVEYLLKNNFIDPNSEEAKEELYLSSVSWSEEMFNLLYDCGVNSDDGLIANVDECLNFIHLAKNKGKNVDLCLKHVGTCEALEYLLDNCGVDPYFEDCCIINIACDKGIPFISTIVNYIDPNFVLLKISTFDHERTYGDFFSIKNYYNLCEIIDFIINNCDINIEKIIMEITKGILSKNYRDDSLIFLIDKIGKYCEYYYNENIKESFFRIILNCFDDKLEESKIILSAVAFCPEILELLENKHKIEIREKILKLFNKYKQNVESEYHSWERLDISPEGRYHSYKSVKNLGILQKMRNDMFGMKTDKAGEKLFIDTHKFIDSIDLEMNWPFVAQLLLDSYLLTTKENNEIIQLLLDNGANINAWQDGKICQAIEDKNIDLIKILILYNANIHTALCLAAKHGYLEVIPLLLEAGANVHCYDHGGKPLSLAIQNGHDEVARLLKEAGAKF